jgi:hypothetical protein
MISLTQDQIREALIRLREYSGWMYYTETGVKLFEANEHEHKGRRFRMSVRMDGKVLVTLQDAGVAGVFDAVIATGPRENPARLNGVDYRTQLENRADLSAEDAAYLDEVGIFVLSFFQRMNAFLFFARMAPVSIDGIAADLTKAFEPAS